MVQQIALILQFALLAGIIGFNPPGILVHGYSRCVCAWRARAVRSIAECALPPACRRQPTPPLALSAALFCFPGVPARPCLGAALRKLTMLLFYLQFLYFKQSRMNNKKLFHNLV